jgi:hypothetical protein
MQAPGAETDPAVPGFGVADDDELLSVPAALDHDAFGHGYSVRWCRENGAPNVRQCSPRGLPWNQAGSRYHGDAVFVETLISRQPGVGAPGFVVS